MTCELTNDYMSMSIPQLTLLIQQLWEMDILPIEKIQNACYVLRLKQGEPETDISQKWEKFVESYDEDPLPMYEDAIDDTIPVVKIKGNHSPKHHHTVRTIAIAAAAVAAFAAFSATAIGSELEQNAVVLVKSALSLPIGNGFMDYDSLAEALDAYDGDITGLPIEAEEGYSLTTMNVDVEPGIIHYFAEYQDGNDNYNITITQYTDGTTPSLKTAPGAEEITVGSIDCFISNSHRTSCRWATGTSTCTIKGDLTEDQVIDMLEAIEN